MPIIIDANRACDFSRPVSSQAAKIMDRIAQKKMRVVVGGELARELVKTKLRDLLQEWARAGRLSRYENGEVDKEEERIKLQSIRSDDPHLLALAILSGCRLLYTEDKELIRDFKDTSVISPKGRVVKPTTSSRVAALLFERFGR